MESIILYGYIGKTGNKTVVFRKKNLKTSNINGMI